MSFMARICGYVLFIIGLIFLVKPVFAGFSFGIDSVEPTTVSSKEQSVTVHLSLSDLPTGDSYLRVAWQESEGKSYFGYMQNNSGDWVKILPLNADCTGYVKISDTAIVATLSAKIGVDADINPGPYMLKVHRFAAGCSYSSITPTAQISVAIPTSTPTPTVVNTPTPSPTPRITVPPTPTRTPTPTPAGQRPLGGASPSPTPTPNPTVPPLPSRPPAPIVLGESDSPTATSPATGQIRPLVPYIISLAFVGLGLGVLSFALILLKRNAILEK
jgi:hypothetical protein